MKTLLLALVVLGVGCAHATKTRAQEEGEATASDKEVKPPQRTETLDTSPSTAKLFKPDGLKKLQEALAAKGQEVKTTGRLDASTQKALREYQKANELPDTGLPDFETLRRLGLKPEEVFERDLPGEKKAKTES